MVGGKREGGCSDDVDGREGMEPGQTDGGGGGDGGMLRGIEG